MPDRGSEATMGSRTVIQKFGGSSVADVEKLRRVAARVKARRDEGWRVVVVVSAMGDTTDELLSLAKKIAVDPPRRELDMLLTCGERISMALLSMALQEQGVGAISFTGSQSGIITDETHAQARIIEVRPARIEEALNQGKVVIVAGYQGVSRAKEITTLGRGGSDTSAVALAAALGADCEIYSDVDGIFSADPRLVPQAIKLEEISLGEMAELAAAGAKVLNAQAVELARTEGITIHARSTHGAGTGTAIVATAQGTAKGRVKGITCETDVWVLSADQLGPLLEALAGFALKPRLVLGGAQRAQAVLSLQDVHAPQSLRAKLPSTITVRDDLATVTLVGTGLQDEQALTQAISTHLGTTPALVFISGLQMTLVVPRDDAAFLTQRLHSQFIF